MVYIICKSIIKSNIYSTKFHIYTLLKRSIGKQNYIPYKNVHINFSNNSSERYNHGLLNLQIKLSSLDATQLTQTGLLHFFFQILMFYFSIFYCIVLDNKLFLQGLARFYLVVIKQQPHKGGL